MRVLPTAIFLHPLKSDGDSHTFTLPHIFTDKYTLELSQESNITIRNNTFVVYILTNITYNITLYSCSYQRIFKIGKYIIL